MYRIAIDRLWMTGSMSHVCLEDSFARDGRKFAKSFGDVHSGSNVGMPMLK